MQTKSSIAIIGAGYVGLPIATVLAYSGYTVYIIETNKNRLESIKKGQSFFHEEGLDKIIKATLKTGNLIATNSYAKSIPNCNIIFSCVGTPDNLDGSLNLTYIFNAAEEVSRYISSGTIYVQKSTVPVGTGKRIKEIFKTNNKHATYVSNPEFLRESSELYDILCPDRVVVGGEDKIAVNRILNVYKQIERHRNRIANLSNVQIKPCETKFISTDINSAELIKVTANAFLALKISFANSIAKLADKVDADIVEIMKAVGSDKRIGHDFFEAGRGYGGGCLPKDVSGLIASGMQNNVSLDIVKVTQEINNSMPSYIVEKLRNAMDANLDGKKIAVLGLTFKPGTSDMRQSPGILIANLLQKANSIITIYDPCVKHKANDDIFIHHSITLHKSIESTIKNVDAIVVSTGWPEFLNYEAAEYAESMRGKVFVDAVNQFSISDIEDAGLTYVGVGR